MEVVFKNIEKRYGSVYAVKDLDLTIKDGALHFLLGPSGCGKTTTLRMLAGLEKPTGGKIFFGSKDVTNMPAAERGIGMVFQNYALWPHMTVRKNIEFGLKLRKMNKAEIADKVADVLQITQLDRFVDRYPGQLSGGQQQRVALARALAIRPNVLLLDEPLSNLDAKLRLEMRENILRIHEKTKLTTVYVTHDQKEALSMGTEISVMRAGVLTQTDTPKAVYHRPRTPFIASFIGETNLLTGTYLGKDGKAHKVETTLGTFLCNSEISDIRVNDKVMLSIRPEAVRIDFGEKVSGENSFSATWDKSIYLGESEQIMLHGGDESIKVNLFHVPDYNVKKGDKVRCSVGIKDVLLLAHDSDVGSLT
ncbi:MAG: ABC transporter ATP-binding protein [Oligoflexales bacterium]